MNIFLGFNFYGAGNIGDDLTLAGFLILIPDTCRVTCVIPRNPSSQQQRFPQINWIQGDQEARTAAIQDCDVWIGVGATAFSTVRRAWLLHHIRRDLEVCFRFKKPAALIGVDAEKTLLTSSYHGLGAQVLRQLRYVITRDDTSVEILNTLEPTATAEILSGMDLANLILAEWTVHEHRDAAADRVGICYWEEEMDLRQLQRLRAALRCLRRMGKTITFFANEIRTDFEYAAYRRITRMGDRWRISKRMRFTRPPFSRGSLTDLVAHYANYDVVASSRYHALLFSAWMGYPTVAIGKRFKIVALAHDLGLPLIRPPWSASMLSDGITQAVSVKENVLRYYQERMDNLRSSVARVLELG